MIQNLLDRLEEPSSWAAIATVLAMFGISIEAGLWSLIVQAGAGVSALVAFFVGEKSAP